MEEPKIKDKYILNRIAKEWAKGILKSCDTDAFGDLIEEGYVTEDEAGYIVDRVTKKIANRLSEETDVHTLDDIVIRYYTLED